PGRAERKPSGGDFVAQAEDPAVGRVDEDRIVLGGLVHAQGVGDSDQPALGLAALRAQAVANQGLSEQGKVRIDFDAGNSRFDVTGFTPEFRHSAGEAGYKSSASGRRVNYRCRLEVQICSLRLADEVANDRWRSEIGRLLAPDGRAHQQRVKSADPVVP